MRENCRVYDRRNFFAFLERARELKIRHKDMNEKMDELKKRLDLEMEKVGALKKRLDLEMEKVQKLESALKESNERCARLVKIFGVDYDILLSMEQFCESMVSSRGALRGDEAKDSLVKILKQSDSKLRECGMAMFESTKGSDDESSKTISKARFRTFLQVLFIRYPTLIGGQLLTKVKDLAADVSDDDVESDFWYEIHDTMMFNVPPSEDCMRGAITAIDKRMEKYCGSSSKTESVSWEEFQEVIVNDMIGALHKHTREMGLVGLYLIDDYKEELAERIKLEQE